MTWLSWLKGGKGPMALGWSDDPFFRPTVGFFVGGVLAQVAPTFRTPPDLRGPGGWPCAYQIPPEIEEKQATGSEPVVAVCLESGATLWGEPEPLADQRPIGRLSIDAVLSQGYARQRPWDVSGFPRFLALAPTEQVQLLYRDALGRNADPSGLAFHLETLLTGEKTILDIRDTFLGSEEFRGRRLSRGEHVGNWIVWGGLKDVPSTDDLAAYLAPGSGAASVGAGQPLDADGLARLALGPAATDAVLQRWKQDHGPAIATLLRPVARKATEARPPRATPVAFRGMLGSMSVDRAGTMVGRSQPVVRALVGRKGHVLFGPYLSLRAGGYGLTARVRGRSDPKKAAGGHIGIDVTYRDVLLAQRFFPVPDAGVEAALTVGFAIQPTEAALMNEAHFEFRVWSDGIASFETLDIDLVDHGPAEADAARADVEWLPKLAVGRAGAVGPGGLQAVRAASGHVFFGPYTCLSSGTHSLVVEATGEEPVAADQQVDIDIVSDGRTILAAQRFRLTGGPNRWVLPFDIAPVTALGDLPHKLEFRLHKSGRAMFTVSRVATTPTA